LISLDSNWGRTKHDIERALNTLGWPDVATAISDEVHYRLNSSAASSSTSCGRRGRPTTGRSAVRGNGGYRLASEGDPTWEPSLSSLVMWKIGSTLHDRSDGCRAVV
jgi:hypothetical protein